MYQRGKYEYLCKIGFNIFFSHIILYTTPSFAKNVQEQSIDKIIDSAYTLHMNNVFLEITNRSYNSKILYDFLSKLIPIKQNKSVENLKVELNKLKSPKVTVKNNSFLISRKLMHIVLFLIGISIKLIYPST